MDGNRILAVFFSIIFLSLSALPVSMAADAQDPKKALSGIDVEGFKNREDSKVPWSQNPFVKPTSSLSAEELKLRGIVYSKDDAAAIIGSQMVRKGDKIGYNDVVDIDKSFVILRNENGLFKLTLEEEN